jgi:predicted lipoprotein with Yx(FWY)xxD motif
MQIKIITAALVFAGLSAGAALAEAPKAGETSAGPTLIDSQGMTLYTFDSDTEGKSNCTGGCASNWPPAEAAASDAASGDFSIIKRDDGSAQWAHKGKPLYTWANDAKPGDATGGSVPGWHVAAP